MAKPTASFNGSDFASSVIGLIVVGLPLRFPNRQLDSAGIPDSDASVVSRVNYKDKKVNVIVEIGRNTREQFDDSYDQLMTILQAKEAALITSFGSSTRQWICTLSNVSIQDLQGGHATLDIEFFASDPVGTDVSSTSLFSETRTTASSTPTFRLLGSHEWQQPVITLTLTALTGGSAKTIIIGNSNTGQEIQIVRDWTAGDVLVIDSRSRYKTVKVNGTEVRYTGSIPEWALGNGSLDYSDNLTTRTRTLSALYYKRNV